MEPGEMNTILLLARNTLSGEVPFVYQQVINLSGKEVIAAGDYEFLGRVTEYKVGKLNFFLYILVV